MMHAPRTIGRIEAIFRYPIKSMRGEPLDAVALGWHGLAGDRRLAFHMLDDHGGFPWLSASRLPDLVRFAPQRSADGAGVDLPTHVLTLEGDTLEAFGDALAADVGCRARAAVEMMRLNNGIFDDAPLSVITTDTVREICRLADQPEDVRRFRPNVLVSSTRGIPFEEDEWLGGTLAFGDGDDAAAVAVTAPDVRCAMVNIHPDSGVTCPAVLKAVVRTHDNHAGVYATVTRVGRLSVGMPVVLRR